MTRRVGVVLAVSSAVLAGSASAQVQWEPLYEPGSGGAMVSISVSPHDFKRVLVAGDMLGVGLSTDRGDSWKWATGFKSWEMADISWHPRDAQTVWIGSMMGPYLSQDGGATWVEKRGGMPAVSGVSYSVPVEKILFDPDQQGRLLAFGGTSRGWNITKDSRIGVVWESTDQGENWRKLTVIDQEGSDSSKDRGLNIVAASYLGRSGTKLMCLAEGGGVYLSDDDGVTWTRSNGGLGDSPDVGRLAVHPINELIAYIGLTLTRTPDGKPAPGAVYKTEDGGRTWTSKANGLGQVVTKAGDGNLISNYRAVALSASNPEVLYTCDGSWAQGIIYKSTDAGESWNEVCTRGQRGQADNALVGKIANLETATFAGVSMGYMTVAPTDANAVYAINSEYIARSLDGGKTWDDATAFRPDPSAPDNWRGRGYSGWCSTNIAFHPSDANTSLLLMMDAGKGWLSRDRMKSWKYVGHQPWAWGGASAAAFSGDVIYLTAGQFGDNLGIHRISADGKQTVLAGTQHGLPELHKGGQATGIYAMPKDPQKVWATIGGKLYASFDGGEHWELLEGAKKLEWIEGDPTMPSRFYISGADGVFVCEDGRTLRNIGGPKPAGRGRLHVDGKGRVYACQWRSDGGGLWRYEAGQWSQLRDDRFAFDVATNPASPERIALVTSDDPYHDHSFATGVWVSEDDGKTWKQANDGLPMLRLQCIEFNPHDPEELIAGSFGSGFFRGRWQRP